MSDRNHAEPFEHGPIPWRFAHDKYDVSDNRLVANPKGGHWEYEDPIPVP